MNNRPGRFGNERGVALLLTLVILALLTAVVVEFDYGARINLITAGNFRDEVRATYLAKTGLAAARAVLRDDAANHGAFDSLDEFWAQPLESFPLGEGSVTGRITDESGKLNINLLASKDSQKWKPIWKKLFNTLQIDPEVQDTILDSIKDWIDEDSETETFGAEDDYYQSQTPSYSAKNAWMDTIGEFRYIKGVTPEIYEILTTKCGGPCFTVANTTAINVNTVSLEVCEALHLSLNATDCQALIDQRKNKPVQSIDNETDFPPSWGGVGGPTTGYRYELKQQKLIDKQSQFFSVNAQGTINETTKVINALVKKEGTKIPVVYWSMH